MKMIPKIKPLYWLFLIFIGPILVAQITYLFHNHLSLNTTQAGILLRPPILAKDLGLDGDNFKDRWRFLYVKSSNCDKICLSQIELLNNIRIALGKDQNRVQLEYISSLANPGFFTEGSVWILDPQGFLIMYYPANTLDTAISAKGILEDTKRLLRYSHAR